MTASTDKMVVTREPAAARADARRKSIGMTVAKRELFLRELRKGFSVKTACDRSNVARRTAYDERTRNKAFREAWGDACEAGTDLLEDEALVRATVGHVRPIYQGGKHVGDERVMSDRLLELLLKARRPKKYRERIDHTHGGDGEGGAIPVDIKGMTGAQLDILKQRILAGLGAAVAGAIADGRKDLAAIEIAEIT